MKKKRRSIRAVSRIALVVVIILIIVIAGAGIYLASVSQKATTSSLTATTSISSSLSSSSSSTTFSSSSSTPVSSTSSPSTMSSSSLSASTSTSQSSATVSTLSIDDVYWPIGDLNQLQAVNTLPFPDWLEYTVYQPLVDSNLSAQYGQGVFQYEPVLAQNWTVSSNVSVYTFNLRPDLNFSNGDPLNSYQIWAQMYGLYYLSDNSSTWFESYDLFNMNASNFGPATLALLNQSGVINPSSQLLSIMQNSSWPIYTNGPDQIVFHLQSPFQWFTGILVSTVGLIFDTQYVLEHGGFGSPTGLNSNFNQSPIPGTGPYIVTSVSEDAYVQLAQNTNYWGKSLSSSEVAANPAIDPGQAKNVIIYYKTDDLARYADLSSGAVQIASIESADWNLVLANPSKFAYYTTNYAPVTGAIAFNTQVFPTNITAFRQAIVHAINYSNIIQTVFYGEATPFMGPEYPAQQEFYDLGNYTPYQYNLTLAKQYLAQSNLTNIPTLSFTSESDCTACTEIAQIIQSDLAQLNITVNIEVLSATDYSSPYGSYSYEVQNAAQIGQLSIWGGISTWVPIDLTPAAYWLESVSNGSAFGNWAVYSNPIVQACVNSFTNGSSTSQILTLCTAAQKQIYNDAPYAWYAIEKLWYGTGSLVWNKNVVSGFYTDPTWGGYSDLPLFNTVTFI